VSVVRFVHLLALGLWIGAIVFFSFVVAPAVFGVLGPERAGDVVAVVFPRYYLLGGVAAAVALATGGVLARGSRAAGWWTTALVALTIGLGATAYAGGVVEPEARQLRAAMHAAGEGSAAASDFHRLHATAVGLNVAALVAAVVGLGCSSAALRPS